MDWIANNEKIWWERPLGFDGLIGCRLFCKVYAKPITPTGRGRFSEVNHRCRHACIVVSCLNPRLHATWFRDNIVGIATSGECFAKPNTKSRKIPRELKNYIA
jgi:hypothetical protein